MTTKVKPNYLNTPRSEVEGYLDFVDETLFEKSVDSYLNSGEGLEYLHSSIREMCLVISSKNGIDSNTKMETKCLDVCMSALKSYQKAREKDGAREFAKRYVAGLIKTFYKNYKGSGGKIKPKDKPHYVNNAQFSQAVVDYCTESQLAEKNDLPKPVIPDYIAQCFLKICEGLSHKANFVRYTYREEMVMDAVENCLKAIENYNIEAATRTGKPNAFAYFTQISWFAFLRRIEKEKKQQEIKSRYLGHLGVEDRFDNDLAEDDAIQVTQAYVDTLRLRIDEVKARDAEWKDIVKKERKRRTVKADSDLSDFIID
jgi:hypothetical protein